MNTIIASISCVAAPHCNPIYFYGSSTQLGRHIDSVVERVAREPGGKPVRVNAAEFSSALIRGLIEGNYDEVRSSFRLGDILIFENIEGLGGKENSQEEFYSLFDFYFERRKQIIISSSVPPRSLHRLEDRVRTQVESGLIFCVDYMGES